MLTQQMKRMLLAAAAEVEVRQFLGVQRTCNHAERRDDGKDFFHMCFVLWVVYT